MNRVALGTGCNLLPLVVRLVAGEAVGNVPMGCVACGAGNLGVLALRLGKLLSRTGVALEACIGQGLGNSHLLRGMGVSVTAAAVGDLRPVRLAVATGALRHNGIEVGLFRIVRMEHAMALLAIELMLCTVLLYLTEITRMTLSALIHRKWLRLFGIQLGRDRDLYLELTAPLCGECRAGND